LNTTSPRRDRAFYAWNALASSAAVALIAFILLREGAGPGRLDLRFLPAVNAALNGLAALCLGLGFAAIRRKAVSVHRRLMVAAFGFSALFLVSYLSYHFVHGDTKFTGTGPVRAVYFFVLVTHVVLSITVVPLALTSFYLAFRGAFERHRRLNRVFLPIWMYVSVTGVAIYFFLR
jgi:putative membrane protein